MTENKKMKLQALVELALLIQTNAAPGNPGGRATIDLIRMLVKGIEPPAYALRVRCSTPELHQQVIFANRNYYNSFCEYCKPNFTVH